jgi:proteic killer suppression protein
MPGWRSLHSILPSVVAAWTAIALVLVSGASAGDAFPPGYAGLVEMVSQARTRGTSREEKAQILQVASAAYTKLLADEDHLDPRALQYKFQTDADFRAGLTDLRNPHSKYRDLYSEINYLASSLISDGVFDRCNAQYDPKWLQEQALTKNILEQGSKYQATCEGTVYSGNISFIMHDGVDPKTKREIGHAVPMIFAGSNAADILNLSNTVVMASSLNETQQYLGQTFPAFADRKLKTQTQDAYLEVKRTEALKGEIYDNALVNSLKTKASIEYFFGGKTGDSVLADLKSEIDRDCASCTKARKEKVINRAIISVYSQARKDPTENKQYPDARTLVVKLCNQLIHAGYYDYYSKNVNRRYENGKFVTDQTARAPLTEASFDTPRPEMKIPNFADFKAANGAILADNTRVASVRPVTHSASPVPSGKVKFNAKFDLNFKGEWTKYLDKKDPNVQAGSGIAMDEAWEYSKYQKQRMEIYQSVVKQGSANLLFLTDSLSARRESDQGVEYSPRMGCTQDSINADANLIDAALSEAKSKTDDVIKDLNDTIKPANLADPKAAETNRKAIEEMIRKNPTATGEAVADRPDLAGLVCDGLNRDLLSDQRKKAGQEALTWGVTIVGTALTLTGVGAGAGVGLEMLVAGSMLASSATLTVNQHIQSENARELAGLYNTQFRGGQSQNGYVLDLSEENVKEYQSLKVGIMDVFGVSVDAVGLVGAALKTTMTIASLNKLVHIAEESKDFKNFAKDKDPLEALQEFGKTHGADMNPTLALQKDVPTGSQFSTRTSSVSPATAAKFPNLAAPVEIKSLSASEISRVKGKSWDPVVYAEGKSLAEHAIGPLTTAKNDAVYEAHLIGDGTHGYGTYTKTQILQKRRILVKAGFSDAEIDTLILKGIAGGDAPLSVAELSKQYAKPRYGTNEVLMPIAKQPIEDTKALLSKLENELKELKSCETYECRKAFKNLSIDYDDIWGAGLANQKKVSEAAKTEYIANVKRAEKIEFTATSGLPAKPGGPGSVAEVKPEPVPAIPVERPTDFSITKRLSSQQYSVQPKTYTEIHKELGEIQAQAEQIKDAENPVNLAGTQKMIDAELGKIASSKASLQTSVDQYADLAKYEGAMKPDELVDFKKLEKTNHERTQILADLKQRESKLVEERKRISGLQDQWAAGVTKEPSSYIRALPADKNGRVLLALETSAKDVANLPPDKVERLLASVEERMKAGKYKFDYIAENDRATDALYELATKDGVDARNFPQIKAKLESTHPGMRWRIPEGSKYIDPVEDFRLTRAHGEKELGRPLTEAEAKTLYDAHVQSRFQLGKDGVTNASKDGENYTWAQLKAKTTTLRKEFSEADATKLLREGVAGDGGAAVTTAERIKQDYPAGGRAVDIEKWKSEANTKLTAEFKANGIRDPAIAARSRVNKLQREAMKASRSVASIPGKGVVLTTLETGAGGKISKSMKMSESLGASVRKLPPDIRKKLAGWVEAVEKNGMANVRTISGYHDHPLLHVDFKSNGIRSVYLNKQWRVLYRYDQDGLIEITNVTPHKYEN